MNAVPANGTPSSEVTERATRRRFTAEYKQKILAEYERLPSGERGALLRREGLYSSHIDAWRKLRDRGALSALAPRRRGPKPSASAADKKEVARLQRHVARLEQKLKRAETIIEIQKKVAAALKELDEESEGPGESES